MKEEERRLVWRVLRYWKAHGGRFPHRDEIDPWLPGEDGANCRLIAVQSPIELSHFVVVGANLAVAFCNYRHLGRRSLVTSPAGAVGASRSDDRGPRSARRHERRRSLTNKELVFQHRIFVRRALANFGLT
jgi:hypothetical protein